MIGRLNHVAIAVRDLGKAVAVYRDVLGAEVSAAVPQPDHGVTTVFITLPNTKIELLEPLGEGSPIAKFLERNQDGGMHHLCYEVDDIRAARDALKAADRKPTDVDGVIVACSNLQRAYPAIAVEVSSVTVEDRAELDHMAPGVADAIARGAAAFRPSYIVPTNPGERP